MEFWSRQCNLYLMIVQWRAIIELIGELRVSIVFFVFNFVFIFFILLFVFPIVIHTCFELMWLIIIIIFEWMTQFY